MSGTTKIEWTEATWNPVSGCTKVSPGCDHCYAERITERFHGPGSFTRVQLHEDKLDLPHHWRKSRRVFVNSMSDLFHDDVPDEYIARVWQVMASTPQHTYQILTKRHARMRAWVNRCAVSPAGWITHDGTDPAGAYDGTGQIVGYPEEPEHPAWWGTGRHGGKPRHKPQPVARGWPLPNVWLGVSVEDQKWADIRIPALLETPAAVRFLSCEPLLGPVDGLDLDGIGWLIAGGESGPGARPMRPAWATSLRDQCQAAGVPFFFKQWGAYRWIAGSRWDEATTCWVDDGILPERVSRKLSGRKLDGRTWDEYPERVA
ncbi:MAG: phage Gp37/Gp68 family protein [Actinomycetota bacterium]|nr:phage Gp37/Gp68 family protein [Actinomycetota bacterium]